MTMFQTNPVALQSLLDNVDTGKIQLPEFQRGWVWDDYRIRALLASISRGFPIGAVMTLRAGGDINFKARLVEGVDGHAGNGIDQFLLDGQQRLTSLYQALKYSGPVDTHDSRGKRIRRWYYIDMLKAMDDFADREEAIVSVPEEKLVTRDFGRETVLDLSTPELEYENHMMPTERLFNAMDWMFAYDAYWRASGRRHPTGDLTEFRNRFSQSILSTFTGYQLPVIDLAKETPKEAVCTVFEKVNTGGVTLTVFELVTASFAADPDAADDFALRDDWAARRERMHQAFGVLRGIEGEQFLQAITLLATQQRRREKIRVGEPAYLIPRIGCQKRDVLNLTLAEYNRWADEVEDGFKKAAKFLHRQYVLRERDVPYNTQLIPLAVLHVELGHELNPANANARLEHWYWSGIFSEAYGGAIETQYALDLAEVADYVRNGTPPRLITEASFNPERLISLRTRNSAAYKGLFALQMKSGAADWGTGEPLQLATLLNEGIDIHHIFPVAWCRENPPVPSWLYNSIINKTPIDARTNRMIGGRAPSEYLLRLRRQHGEIDDVLRSHWLDPDLLKEDDFFDCFIERGEQMINLIAKAMGKETASGRDVFRNALIRGMPPELIPDDEEEDPTLNLGETEEFDEIDDDYDEVGEAAYEEDEIPL